MGNKRNFGTGRGRGRVGLDDEFERRKEGVELGGVDVWFGM